jgi:hypothetical protein
MRCEIEDFHTGWFQVSLRLRPDEIDGLIEALRRLGPDAHFHIMSDHDGDGGVADIEISLQGEHEASNMHGSYAGKLTPKASP